MTFEDERREETNYNNFFIYLMLINVRYIPFSYVFVARAASETTPFCGTE